MPEETLAELDADETVSVDEFIRELEAKEKDLHITADLTIEVEESDFDPNRIPDFVQEDLSGTQSRPSGNSHGSHQPGPKTRVYELENEIEKLKDRNKSLRAERNEIQEKSDRRLKDFENYKYRMDRERRGAFIDHIANLVSQMLPVMDNLGRAIEAADVQTEERRAEFKQFYDGIVLVNQQINEVFAGMGVLPIATIGETFDPGLHEAVATEENDQVPHNTISAEMLRGYRIGNKVIRHSMVKVTTLPPAKSDKKADKKNDDAAGEKPNAKTDDKTGESEPLTTPIPEPSDLLPDLDDTPDLDISTDKAES